MSENSVFSPDAIATEHLSADHLVARLCELRQAGFTMLLDIGGIDYPQRAQRFEVVYLLLKMPTIVASVESVASPERRRLIVAVGADQAVIPSVTTLWPNANWAEREIYDLFGVHFSGHPDMRRIQMPADWEGFPLRKDYPMRGPAREATPRPNFPLKSNVDAGTPAAGRVAEALQRRRAADQKARESQS